MKTIMIPETANPYKVIVNGRTYTYDAGSTVEVPDEVAAVIKAHCAAHEKQMQDVVPPFDASGSTGVLDANGKLLNSVLPEGHPSKENVEYGPCVVDDAIDRFDDGDIYFYKITDATPTLEELKAFNIYDANGDVFMDSIGNISSYYNDETVFHDKIMPFIYVCYATKINVGGEVVTVPSTGIYLSEYCAGYTVRSESITPCPRSFLPESVGGSTELILDISSRYTGSWTNITVGANMAWADAKATLLDGSLTNVKVVEDSGNEYQMRVWPASIRSASLDEGMSYSLCVDWIDVVHSGGSSIEVYSYSLIWQENSASINGFKLGLET
ncbi:MAG: hypothetical protein J6J04_04725 [Oscillospiraceae bacterium]|nr:hypothetical protein [Oscillospiraceae bacterium]